MTEWKEYTLGGLISDNRAELQTGPFGTMLNAREYTKVGTPVIAVQDIGENRLTHGKLVFISEETANRLSRYKLQLGDIIFSRKGAVERRAIIKKSEAGWLQGSDCIRLRLDNTLSPPFISYQLGTSYLKEWLFQNAHGATMPSLNQEILGLLPLMIPPLPEQRAIASVLSSLDDKIDLLHRQNKTLEAMAEALFRKWFVEEVEEEWEEGKMPDEFDYVMGSSPPGESYNENRTGIPMFQGNADFGFRFPKERVYTTEPVRFAEKHDTLISVRAPVGAQNMAQDKCCIGRGVAAFRYKQQNDCFTYTYYKMKSLMKEIERFNDTGTVFGAISKADFEAFDLTIPPKPKVLKFEEAVMPIDAKVILNCKQIELLEKLRDTILPKLISGEVHVDALDL